MAGARAAKVKDVVAVSAAEIVEALSEGAGLEVESGSTRSPAGPQVYVVQVRNLHPADDGGEEVIWVDIATVTVPPRTKARAIIERALVKADPQVELPVTLRILDAGAAREFPVGLRPRDPELVIG